METTANIFKRLCRHLHIYNETTAIGYVKANNLQTNADWVDAALESMRLFELTPQWSAEHVKNDALSAEFRSKGNELYKSRNFKLALRFYNKSIASADPIGENLGLAYGNRSAVLYEMQMFHECLQDIDRALETNYPSKGKNKLIMRKQKAEGKDQKLPKPQRCMPTLKDINPKIPCASNSVEIKFSEDLGRHIVATKDIKVGEVICIEKPFASVILESARFDYCHHCLEYCCNMIPCKYCSYALFCSENCMEMSKHYHKYECKLLGILLKMGYNKIFLSGLRVAILAKDDFDKIETYEKKPTDEIYESARYKEIHNLCTNADKRRKGDMLERALNAAIIFLFLKEETPFFDDYPGTEQIFKHVLLIHLQTSASNFHQINNARIINGELDEKEIGSAACSFLSLFNHSCNPNVHRSSFGTTLVLWALSPIKQGQQLFDNYGYHYALIAKSERQDDLKTVQYFFDCKCEACEGDWPMLTELERLPYEEISKDDLENLINCNAKTASSLLKSFFKRAEELESSKPTENLCTVQECIKQCYVILEAHQTIPF